MYKTYADAANAYLAGYLTIDELQRIAAKFADEYVQELQLQRGAWWRLSGSERKHYYRKEALT